jgi:adenylate cyclase
MSSENCACVLLAGICGTSRLIGKLGAAEAKRAIDRYLNRVERACTGFKGQVVKTVGDELLAVFDATESALHAATEMQQRVESLPPVSGISLALRVACHSGPLASADDPWTDLADTATALATHARPGQILVTAPAVAELPQAMRNLTAERELPPSADGKMLRASEYRWNRGAEEQNPQPPEAPAMPVDPVAPCVTNKPDNVQLRLRYGEQELLLDTDRPSAILGRDLKADVVIRDPRASRHHGRIERRYDHFVLIDQSTNGTYVTLRGETGVLLRQEEAVLRDHGRINFGHAGDDGEHLEFEVLERDLPA